MLSEFLATYALPEGREDLQRAGIDFLLGLGKPPAGFDHLAAVSDPLARIDLLAQALVTGNKDYARAGERRQPGGLPQLYRSQAFCAAFDERRNMLATLGLLPALPDLTDLSLASFGLHFTFTLRTPYISKDDVGLHILDNPVRKDKVFGLPMVAPTGWKGALRAAIRQNNGWSNGHLDLLRLFGDARDDETGQAGRLFFYPTFFTQLGLEVINPHDRKSNAGAQPIYFECAPAGAQGDFTLLYVPFDHVGGDEDETRGRALADLKLVAAGVKAMMSEYGFGAKTSSGFGLASERVGAGKLTLRSPETAAAPSTIPVAATAPVASLPRYLETPDRLAPEYRNPDGSFRQWTEAELKAMKKADRQLYDKAKSWWEREGKALFDDVGKPELTRPGSSAPPATSTWAFVSFSELAALASQMVQELVKEGAQ